MRPLKIEDAKVSWKWRNDPEVWQFTTFRNDQYVNEDIETEWLKKTLTSEFSRRFAIMVDEVYVGNVQLTDITSRDAEFHIFIGTKNFWGKGIAKIATYQILHFGKYELKLDYVHLFVHPLNTAAKSIYEKTGFKFTCEADESGFLMMSLPLSELLAPR